MHTIVCGRGDSESSQCQRAGALARHGNCRLLGGAQPHRSAKSDDDLVYQIRSEDVRIRQGKVAESTVDSRWEARDVTAACSCIGAEVVRHVVVSPKESFRPCAPVRLME